MDDLCRTRRTVLEWFTQSAAVILFLSAPPLVGTGLVSLFSAGARHGEIRPFSVDRPVKSFGDAPTKKRVAVTFTLTNRSADPIRVLGGTPFCGRHGCLSLEGLPLEVPPMAQRELVVFVETREPGQFAAELTLFSDCPGHLRTVFEINGRVTESREKS